MSLTVGSLFSGIGGLELGLERAGMRTVFQVEQNPYAQAVLAKHWPHVPRHDDVRSVGAHNLPACDVLAGGFPCQDVSVAGLGAGLAGERSGLWSEFARLVGELRPAYVLVENVSALLARGLGQVLGDLAARGYDAEWDCLPASAVGAPHQRDRLFIVAYPNGQRCEECEPAAQPAQAGRAGGGHAAAHVPDAHGVGPGRALHPGPGEQPGRGPLGGGVPRGGAAGRAARSRLWAPPVARPWPESNVGRVAHGVPSRVDRLRCLGNAVVPAVAEHLGHLILAHHAARLARSAA